MLDRWRGAAVLFGIGVTIQIEMELRIVRLELGTLFAKKSIDAQPIAVAFAVRNMREHFRCGESA